MLRHFLLLAIAVLIGAGASAQFRYTFKDTVSPYVALSSGTSINGSDIWHGDNYTTTMPFTWVLDSTISMSTFDLLLSIPGFLANLSNPSDVSGFVVGGVDLADRDFLNQMSSLSPIRYAVSGSAPNRIFKVELANAGFYNESQTYNTMNDYVNFQVWLYEKSNILEVHFGPSHITDLSTDLPDGVNFGFFSHVDFMAGSSGMFYYLKDNNGGYAVDSVSITSSTGPTNVPGTWPHDSTVFRFTPRKFCTVPAASFTMAAANGFTGQFVYTGSTAGVDSLVWDFGDGQKQKVTTGFSNLVTHTYASAGKYNVRVTAYTNCASNTSSVQQSAVGVERISGSGNVRVYPNPVHDRIIVEGLKSGKAAVLSMVGQTLIRAEIGGSRQEIDLSALPAGTYQLMVQDAAGNVMQERILKQ